MQQAIIPLLCRRSKRHRTGGAALRALLLSALLLPVTPSLRAAVDDGSGAVPAPAVRTDTQSDTFTVTGHVFDENDEPLMGARVSLVENAAKGAMTDIDGAFRIPGVKPGQTLEVAFVGYRTQRIKLLTRDALTVKLVPDSELLEEVVVTAFGTGQKKASLVGAVQTVRPQELKVPAANLSASFAGRLAGVISVQRSGAPGADGADFWIRGIASTNATNPLIILDGVSVSAADLNALDPEVIEGFSILKDATATALYGSRGANGVVIVKTKSGSDLDRPVINVRIEGYLNTPTKVPAFVDGVRFMELYNEALVNLPTGNAPYSQEKIEGTRKGLDPYVFPNVMWYDELFNNVAFNQKANFNIRGGGQKLDYFISATADHQTGMLKDVSKPYGYDNRLNVFRYSFQNNIGLRFTKTSHLALRLNAQIGNSRGPVTSVNDIFNRIINSNPVDFPIFYPEDGVTTHVKWGGIKWGPARVPNPFTEAVAGYADDFSSTVIANLEFTQDLDFITEGLKLQALASFKNWSSSHQGRYRDNNYYALKKYTPLEDGTYDITLEQLQDEVVTTLKSAGNTYGDRRLYFHTMLLWDRTFGLHSVGAMLNYNQEETATNKPSDNILDNLPYRKQGLAGRLTYSYDNRYVAELNFGYNGSENFAKGYRYGFFPSVALGYNISEERFWEPIKSCVSLLKLRGSYGLVGNDAIGGDRFVYLPQVEVSGGKGYTTGITQGYYLQGPKFSRFANPEITWEVGAKANLGVDLQLFNALNLTVELFREYRTNVFQKRGAVPSYMGTAETPLYGNLAEISNKGVDMSLDYNKMLNKDLWLNVRGTFTFARNRIEKWDEPYYNEYPALAWTGQRLNTYFGYIAERLFIDDAEVAHSPEQKFNGGAGPGDIKYTDLPNRDGERDGQITDNDRLPIGHPTVPEIVYGFGANVKWKGLDAGIFFQGVGNTSLMLSDFHPFGSQYNRNVLRFIADDHWSYDNQNIYASYPRLTKLDHANNTQASTYWLRDASFLKLKNVEVGYSFGHFRVYVTGQNLLTFSKFKLWDPEMGGGNGLKYPTQRTLNIGLQMSFN